MSIQISQSQSPLAAKLDVDGSQRGLTQSKTMDIGLSSPEQKNADSLDQFSSKVAQHIKQ